MVEQGYTKQVSKTELEKAIVYVRGPDQRTITNWLKALVILEFITQPSPFIYELHLEKCPDLLQSAIKEQKQKNLV